MAYRVTQRRQYTVRQVRGGGGVGGARGGGLSSIFGIDFSIRSRVELRESKSYFVYGVVARVLVFSLLFWCFVGIWEGGKIWRVCPTLSVDQGLLRMRTQCVLFCFPLRCVLSCGVIDVYGFV